MSELGAKPFYECADADEVDGLEEAIDHWVGGLWAPLRQALAAKTNSPQVLGCQPDGLVVLVCYWNLRAREESERI